MGANLNATITLTVHVRRATVLYSHSRVSLSRWRWGTKVNLSSWSCFLTGIWPQQQEKELKLCLVEFRLKPCVSSHKAEGSGIRKEGEAHYAVSLESSSSGAIHCGFETGSHLARSLSSRLVLPSAGLTASHLGPGG